MTLCRFVSIFLQPENISLQQQSPPKPKKMLANSPSLTHVCPHSYTLPSYHSKNCKLLLSASALSRFKPFKTVPSLNLLLQRNFHGRKFNFRALAETQVSESPQDALQPHSVKIPFGDRHVSPSFFYKLFIFIFFCGF